MIRTILGYVLIYISIIFGSIFIANKFNKKIESCIAVDILLKMIFMYIFGICNLLFEGLIVCLVTPIILGIITIIKQRKNVEFKDRILTNAFYFFTIIYFCFMIFTYGKMSWLWDEYSHWSLASKEMFYTNKLLPEDGILIVKYPPFPTIWQYLFNKTIGIYNQGTEIFANYILGFALLLPIFESVNSKSKIQNITVGIIIICIPAILYTLIFYEGIYVDTILGMLIGYIICQMYFQKDVKFLKLSMLVAFIVMALTKETGFYISLILICSYIVAIIIEKIKQKTNIKKYIIENKKEIINTSILIIILVATTFSWKIYSKDMKVAVGDFEEYKNKESKEEFIGITEAIQTSLTTLLGSTDKSIDYDQSNRLLFDEMSRQYSLGAPIRITIMYGIILMAIASIILYKYISEEEKNKYKTIIQAIFIGLIIYILFLQLAYLVKFGMYERIIHASLDRYINTYLLGILILLITIILKRMSKSNKNEKYMFTIFTMFILLITRINTITSATIASGAYNAQVRYKLQNMTEIESYFESNLESGARIYVIDQEKNNTLENIYIKYVVAPKFKILANPGFSEELAESLNGDILEVWSKILNEKYDYVYIYKKDEYFEEKTKKLFETEIKERTIYKIEKQEDTIKLVEYKK